MMLFWIAVWIDGIVASRRSKRPEPGRLSAITRALTTSSAITTRTRFMRDLPARPLLAARSERRRASADLAGWRSRSQGQDAHEVHFFCGSAGLSVNRDQNADVAVYGRDLKRSSHAPTSSHIAMDRLCPRPRYVRHSNGRPSALSVARLSSVVLIGMLRSSRPSSQSDGVFTARSVSIGSNPCGPSNDG